MNLNFINLKMENNKLNKEDLIILFSGGADSRLMIELAQAIGKNPYCVIIHYGQAHDEEIDSATKQLDSKNIDYHVVSLIDLNIDSGLTGDGVKNNTGEVHEMHVPGRNSIFLSIAYSVAESKDIDTIWIGCDWSDRLNLFPDCYQEYIVRMNEAFKYAGPNAISIEAPLMGLSKEIIINLLDKLGIKESEYFSGYGEEYE
jgi:7-cyano-7-deazaguanine synthase